MRALLDGSGLSLALALLGGFALVAVLKSASKLVYWLPMSRGSLSRARQWLPILATSLAVLYVVVAGQWLVDDLEQKSLVVAGVLLLLTAACWRAIRDATDGLFLRATGACRTGDYVQLASVNGRVRELGFRFLILETSEGHVAAVPYGEVVKTSMRRLPEVKLGLLHVLRVPLPPGVPLPAVKRRILRAALLCPWCVSRRNARIRTLEHGKWLEVTLSLVDADHATEAEETIRESILNLEPASAPRGRDAAFTPSRPAALPPSGESPPPTTRRRPSSSIPSPGSPGFGRTGSHRP